MVGLLVSGILETLAGDNVRPISGFNVGARVFFTDGVDVGCSGVAGLVVAIVDGG